MLGIRFSDIFNTLFYDIYSDWNSNLFFLNDFDSVLVPPKCHCLTECFFIDCIFVMLAGVLQSFLSICPVFILQFLDSRQTCWVFFQTREEQLWSQQSRVHGEGATEQRGLPAWRLSDAGWVVHRSLAGRSTKLHPVQQPQRSLNWDCTRRHWMMLVKLVS